MCYFPPRMSHTGPILEGKGKTDYERYIRTEELLALQKSVDQLSNPEERLFQSTHQAAEIWLKHVDYEIDRAAEMIGRHEEELAADLLLRCARIMDMLRDSIVILETMAPADYHVIRTSSLGRGSGQESPGFQKLLDVGQRIGKPAEAALQAAGVTPLDVEREPRRYYPLHRLVQAMLEYDSAFMKWRYTHMKLAMRIIGGKVNSLKDVPVMQLEAGTREPLFPQLWETINQLTAEFKPTY
jgi:tryptophan 2,3-dioxygenase